MTIKRSFSKTTVILFAVLFVIFTFFLGYAVGGAQTSRAQDVDLAGRVVATADSSATLEEDLDFNMFWQVWNLVKESYYKQPVSDKQLFYGSLKGILAGAGDPYTMFFDPEEAKSFLANLNGSFQGIGAEIGLKEETLVIIAPLDGSPAQKAGLRPGDLIVKIDETQTDGMTVEEAVMMIRGEKDTVVTLSVRRQGEPEIITFKITRDNIVVDSVKWKIDENNFMRVSVSTFNDETIALFNAMMQEALKKDVDGMIIDLRNNPGGLLKTAVDLASAWTGYETVVIEREHEKAQSFKGVKQARLDGIKTVVLVNGGSASASEIFAGALQDYGYATIVGTQTYGKGSVQDYLNFSDGSAVKITTAQWYTPKGRGINETGITPDIIVDYSFEQFKNDVDPQQDTAIQILLGIYTPPPNVETLNGE